MLQVASIVLYALLLTAWLVVGARTVWGGACGRMFKPMTSAVPAG